jgi:serine phosphatase RsbU (regulator of sigma subunit)
LSKLLCEFTGSTAEELAEAVRFGVRDFTGGAPQADDITMVVLHFKGPSA